jgi:hypothetical protein
MARSGVARAGVVRASRGQARAGRARRARDARARQFGIQPGTKQDRTLFKKKKCFAIFMPFTTRFGSLYCWAMPKKHVNNNFSDYAQCIAVVSTLDAKINCR